MTKDQVRQILTAVADELDATDNADAARAYRRAAELVSTIEAAPTRRRRRRATVTPTAAAPTRRGPGRPRRASPTPAQ